MTHVCAEHLWHELDFLFKIPSLFHPTLSTSFRPHNMSLTPCKIEEYIGDEQLYGPGLYSIPRKIVLNNNLEVLLPLAVEILHYGVGDNLLSVGFYNSVLHPGKVILGTRVKALSTHDWTTLEARLADVLDSEIVIMFIPIAHKKVVPRGRVTVPETPSIGVSIAPVGAEHAGTLGAYFCLRDPKSTTETTVFLTSSQVVRGNVDTAIQSPSRQDIECVLKSYKIRLNHVTAEFERAQDEKDFARTNAGKGRLQRGPVRIMEYTKEIEMIQAILKDPQDAIIGRVLHVSASGAKGTRESKMDWAIVTHTQDTKIQNERPDMNRAPPPDPRIPGYEVKCDVWELKKLDYNRWICFRGCDYGVRSGYTNGMRTFIRDPSSSEVSGDENGSYELEALPADFPKMSDHWSPYFEMPTGPILYAGRLNPLAASMDSGSTVWDEEGDLVGLLWADQSGVVVTSIDEIAENIKSRTGMDIEPVLEEESEEDRRRYYGMILPFP
jgi:hypothetical protein